MKITYGLKEIFLLFSWILLFESNVDLHGENITRSSKWFANLDDIMGVSEESMPACSANGGFSEISPEAFFRNTSCVILMVL